MLRDFRELLYTMPFHVPEDLILLGRTFGILSGMCTGLSPQFNVWNELAPFAKTLIGEESPFEWRRLRDGVWDIASALAAIPRQAETTLEKLNRSELALRIPQVEQQLGRLELTMRRVMGSVLCAAAVLGAVQLEVAGRQTAALGLGTAGMIALVWNLTRRS